MTIGQNISNHCARPLQIPKQGAAFGAMLDVTLNIGSRNRINFGVEISLNT
jgi:hypothetical protein